MAGTDRKRAVNVTTPTPTIILVDPQLGENIGMSARAMLNCGLVNLRLVRPRDGWPSLKATRAASGADRVIDNVTLFDTTAEAIADLTTVYAATARPRDMIKQVMTPPAAAADIRTRGSAGCGILFGGESMGLKNDDIALADTIIQAPLHPGFSSLNLSQAVLLISHAWYSSEDETPPEDLPMRDTRPATKEELLGFFEQFEAALDETGFIRLEEMRPIMVRNLRTIWHRAQLTEQEVRTLRGVVSSFTRLRRPKE